MSDTTRGLPHDDVDPPTVARESLTPTKGSAVSATEWTGIPEPPPGYVILRELNRGGMGVVYLARQVGLHREVALKMVPGASPMDLVRFLAEAENAASVVHSHIVPVYDFGQQDGRPFLAMEYLPGGTLGERVRSKGPLSPQVAASVVAKVAEGVAAAHRVGIVHRDLKPGNVLFDAAGEPKVCDFGLAKRGSGSDLTRTEAVMGTPAYMAPEQARGESKLAGPAADVWGLGVILYECLAGARPFIGSDPWSILNNVMSTVPPPLRTIHNHVPRDLETICLKCLEKSPSARYPSAAEMAADLRLFLEGRPINARPIGLLGRAWRTCARHPALATAVAALVLVTTVVPPVLWSYQTRVNALHAAREAEKQLRAEEERARKAAEESAATQEYFARLNRARRLTTVGAAGWRWSALDELAAASRAATPLRDILDLRAAIADCEAGVDVREVAVVGPVTHLSGAVLAISPDGRTLAVADRRASAAWVTCRLRLYDVASRSLTHDLTFPSGLVSGSNALSLKPDGARCMKFSPDGRFLFVGARSGRVHRWATDDISRAPTTWSGPESSVAGLAFNDGDIAVVHQNGTISLRPLDGNGVPRASTQLRVVITAGEISFVGAGGPQGPTGVRPKAYFVDVGSTIIALDTTTLQPIPSPVRRWRGRTDPPPSLGGLVYHEPTQSVFAHSGGIVYRIDASSGVQTQQFQEPRVPTNILRLAVSPDGALVAAVSMSGRLSLWTTHDSRLVGSVVLGEGFDVSFGADSRTIFVAADRGILTFEVGGLTAHRAVAARSRLVHGFTPGQDPKTVIVATSTVEDGVDRQAELVICPVDEAPRARLALPLPGIRMDCQLVSHTGASSVSIAPGGWELWFADPMARNVRKVVTYDHDVTALTASAEADRVWVVSDATAVLRSASDGVEVARWANLLNVTSGRGGVLTVGAGADTVVVGCRDGQVAFLRSRTAEMLGISPGPGGPVTAAAVVEGRLAIVGNQSGQIRGYSLPRGEVLFTMPAHADQVHSIAVTPGGDLVATAGRDGQVALWACVGQSLQRLVTLTTPSTGTLHRATFTTDGQRLLVHNQGEFGVRCWHIERLRERYRAVGLDW